MRELTKFFNWMFFTVMLFTKRTVRKVEGILYYRKCEKIISDFKSQDRDDVETSKIPVVTFSDYPTVTDLNRYLRENYGMKYPLYIESMNIPEKYSLVLKMVAIGDEFLEHKPGILNFNNGYGKIYTYQEYIMKI